MARPTHVPRFGNWDANDHVPYTAVFESARAGRGQKIINPNDPSEYPEALSDSNAKKDGPPAQPPVRNMDNNAHVVNDMSRKEDREYQSRMQAGGRTQRSEAPVSRMPAEPMAHRVQGETRSNNRTVPSSRKSSLGGGLIENVNSEYGLGENKLADQSRSQSPVYKGRLGNKPGSASPAWERRVSAEGTTAFAPATPGRSRLRPKGDETPDRGSPLPPFGAWDDKDPSSGEGFTVIFNNAREGKKAGTPVRIPPLYSDSPKYADYTEPHKQPSAQHKPSIWRCCFCSSTAE
eukprot:c25306_g1_i1 orf=591-1463(-)